MRSSVKLYKDDVADFYNWLIDRGTVEINTEMVDWRVMMWRLNGEKQWTQAYDGLTNKAKSDRAFLRVFGPNEGFVEQFYNNPKELGE